MKEFRTSLLREKFTITDMESPDPDNEKPIIALSNRIIVALTSDEGLDAETFIIRTQNMHSCARMAAATIKEFSDHSSNPGQLLKLLSLPLVFQLVDKFLPFQFLFHQDSVLHLIFLQ